MVMRTVGNRHAAEDVEDLAHWVRGLTDCPAVTQTSIATCGHPSHGEDPASWFYVEADPQEGVARLRCIADGQVREVLDSGERWTYPKAWSCPACSQTVPVPRWAFPCKAHCLSRRTSPWMA